jgi:hypothetical protein
LEKAPKNFEPPPPIDRKIFNFRTAAADGPENVLFFEPPPPKPENFSAAAADGPKKILIFEPPPPIEASAYTSTCHAKQC